MTLSGDGGDELFMGYGAYRWAQRLAPNYPKMIRYPVAWAMGLGNQRLQRAAWLLRYDAPENLRSHIFSQEQYLFSRQEVSQVLENQPVMPELVENFGILPRCLTPAEQQALFDLKYYLPDDLLVKVDRASMAMGLETRVPLLDYRLIQFALNLDHRLKIRDGKSKWLMRRLLSQYIPSEIFDKPKWGFSIPLSRWLQSDLKFLSDEYLSDAALAKTGIIKAGMVANLLHGFFNQKKHFLYQKVWALIVLQKWLIDNPLKVNLTQR